ncbi:MAG: hypothetical protein NTY51_11035 [Deltaproteobacteria bacterium]|nr:hypothetical protein [Deltaproteobacteria bacterium]
MSGQLPKVLDGMSELMVLSNYPEAKNIMIFGFDLEGAVDTDAMNLALRYALPSFPEFSSSVKERRINGERCLTWFLDPDFNPEFRLSNMDTTDSSLGFQHSLLQSLDQSLEKDWDLLRTVPTEFHLIRLPNGRSSLLTLVHHAAADGWTLASFYRELLAHYHRIMTGGDPEWAHDYDPASSVKNRMVELKRTRWSDAVFFVKKSLSPYITKPTLPKGSGKLQEVGVHYVKSVLTPEQTDRVVKNVSRRGSPFIDALVGGMASAVDKWNASLNISKLGNIVICVTVQMRGRFGETEVASNSSSLIVKLRPGERTNPELFSRTVSERRQEESDSLADVRAWLAGCTLADAVRSLPLTARQRIVHFLCQMPLIPILIAPFGMMWPEIKGGRRTGDSYLKQAGGLNLTEFHTIPYKLGYRCPLILAGYTFRKRLNLGIIASANYFTRAETERFVNLLGDVLVEDPFGVV